MRESWLVLETSDRTGTVGLFVDGESFGTRTLDPGRRPNRDLVPYCAELLAEAGFKPADVSAVAVNIGPGSYTGLRVGMISAKMFAFVTGCRLVAVPSFHAVAAQAPPQVQQLRVISDGLQGLLYTQDFIRDDEGMKASTELRIQPMQAWLAELTLGTTIAGPGVSILPQPWPEGVSTMDEARRTPTVEGVHRAAQRLPVLGRNEASTLEPLYLRPSSAEEQADRRSAGA